VTDEKWHELLERIDRVFKMTDRTIEELGDGPGEVERVEFTGPQGEMLIERTVRPVVLDRKMKYSNRIGAPPTVQYTYSPTEKSDRVRLYRKNTATGEWDELDLDAMFKPPAGGGAAQRW
jgi:hypothetical protein